MGVNQNRNYLNSMKTNNKAIFGKVKLELRNNIDKKREEKQGKQ